MARIPQCRPRAGDPRPAAIANRVVGLYAEVMIPCPSPRSAARLARPAVLVALLALKACGGCGGGPVSHRAVRARPGGSGRGQWRFAGGCRLHRFGAGRTRCRRHQMRKRRCRALRRDPPRQPQFAACRPTAEPSEQRRRACAGRRSQQRWWSHLDAHLAPDVALRRCRHARLI